MVQQFIGKARRRGETLEEWQARVNPDEFKAQHKALWEQGVQV